LRKDFAVPFAAARKGLFFPLQLGDLCLQSSSSRTPRRISACGQSFLLLHTSLVSFLPSMEADRRCRRPLQPVHVGLLLDQDVFELPFALIQLPCSLNRLGASIRFSFAFSFSASAESPRAVVRPYVPPVLR
jgi:hypothetical protein